MDNTVNGLYVIDLKMQETCDIMGVNIVVTDMDKTMTLLESQLEQWRGKYICVANVHTTVTAHEDAEYRYIQNHAVMALPDGGPLSQFSRSWMAAHEDRVQALMIGVGAAFDYEAGNIKRAPMWMQKHNLEWLYRLMQDPKRLFHRYLKTNVKYLLWTWRSGE